jgi:membrane protease YdiL (CAAX protease family)
MKLRSYLFSLALVTVLPLLASMPMALVNGPLWRRLGLLLVVGVVLIGLGIAGAWWFERRIRAPIVALSSAAAALARGGPVQSLPSSSIAEIDSLSQTSASSSA